MSEIDNLEPTPVTDENMSQRPDRERHLSLKASESFELKQKKIVDIISKLISKIDNKFEELTLESNEEKGKTLYKETQYLFRKYTSNCEKLLELYMSVGTAESLSLKQDFVETKNEFCENYVKNLKEFCDYECDTT